MSASISMSSIRLMLRLPGRPNRGLTFRELQLILRGLEALNLVGADVVEVAPAYDHAELTAVAAANVVYELLGLFARQAVRGH